MKFSPTDVAARLVEARRTRRPLTAADFGDGPPDVASAYAVQAGVAKVLGPVEAWKTGRKAPGAEQNMAPILAGGLRPSPAVFKAGELRLVGVELEIAFRVDRPLPPVDAPDFETRARSCVSVAPAIEVVDTRLADHEGAGVLMKLADNQINAGLVVGTPRADWQGMNLAEIGAHLTFGAETVVDGPRPVPGGDAFATFCAFARLVGDHCGGLKVGHFVTTGSLNGLPFIEKGTPVRGRIEGLGEVAVDFPA